MKEITIELDDRPGVDAKYVKRVVDSNKAKVYDRINVRSLTLEGVELDNYYFYLYRVLLVISVDKKQEIRKPFVTINTATE